MSGNAAKNRVEQVETDIAVLHVQFKNLDEKVVDLKTDVKGLHDCLDRRMDETKLMLQTMKEANESSHVELSKKISSIEKIKWMLMGAAAVLGASGTEAIKMLISKF